MVCPRLRLRSVHLLYVDTYYMRKIKPQEKAQKALKILRLGSQHCIYRYITLPPSYTEGSDPHHFYQLDRIARCSLKPFK